MRNRQNDPWKIKYITKATYNRLLQKQKYIERKLRDAEKSVGESAGRRGDWHDNPAYEAAVAEVHYWSSRLRQINAFLQQAYVIPEDVPSEQQATPHVKIGSRVKIEIDGEVMDILLGGSIEGAFEEGVVSYKSPLGQVLLNAKEGDVRTYDAPAGKMTVRILQIL